MAIKNTRGREAWAGMIAEEWNKQLPSILQVGNLLESAKAELSHGEWLKMVADQLPFSKTTATRLMQIAANDNISNDAHGHHLPACWRTLYELTKLTDEQFQSGIDSGAINPRMERKDVAVLRGKEPKPKVASTIAPADRCVMHVRRTVQEALSEMDPKEWTLLIEMLRSDLDEIIQTAELRRRAA